MDKPKEEKRIEYLGCSHLWDFPQIVKDCREKEHKTEKHNIGRDIYQIICRECGYIYNCKGRYEYERNRIKDIKYKSNHSF